MTNAEKVAVFVLNDMEEKNRKATQNQRILAHLFANGAITPMDALRQYGVMRLGARIFDLKKNGRSHRPGNGLRGRRGVRQVQTGG